MFRLSRRGNRRLNHAIHMAAVTQIRHRHSPGRAYYDRKIAEGHSGKEAIRALKRRISDAVYIRLRDDAARASGRRRRAREGNRGTTLKPARPAHTPNTGSSVKPLPNPTPPYDPPHTDVRPPKPNDTLAGRPKDLLTNKEDSIWRVRRRGTADESLEKSLAGAPAAASLCACYAPVWACTAPVIPSHQVPQ